MLTNACWICFRNAVLFYGVKIDTLLKPTRKRGNAFNAFNALGRYDSEHIDLIGKFCLCCSRIKSPTPWYLNVAAYGMIRYSGGTLCVCVIDCLLVWFRFAVGLSFSVFAVACFFLSFF